MSDLTTITIPTPEPYDAEHPYRQRENYYYVQLQLLQAAKTAGAAPLLTTADLADLVAAITALQYNGVRIDLGVMTAELTGRITMLEMA